MTDTTTPIRVYLSVPINGQEDWSRVNEVTDEIARRHPAMTWTGSGTGFGFRDQDFESTDPDAVAAFVAEARVLFDLAGFSEIEVKVEGD